MALLPRTNLIVPANVVALGQIVVLEEVLELFFVYLDESHLFISVFQLITPLQPLLAAPEVAVILQGWLIEGQAAATVYFDILYQILLVF